ncbi:MAG: hypothetical protein SGI77_24630 [Pirellulaceae bacterium]|nr:hypothetical protein [Pirellulaceae bacterium]
MPTPFSESTRYQIRNPLDHDSQWEPPEVQLPLPEEAVLAVGAADWVVVVSGVGACFLAFHDKDFEIAMIAFRPRPNREIASRCFSSSL